LTNPGHSESPSTSSTTPGTDGSRRLRITYKPTSALRPYPRNSKRHPKRQIDALVKSLEEFGFAAPIIEDEHGLILAGHARWKAAKRLNMDVPVVTMEGLSDAQKQAYVITDNRMAELSESDDEMLAMELGELSEMGFDLEAVGYSTKELDDLLGDGALPEVDAGDGDEEPVAGSCGTCPNCGFVLPVPEKAVKGKRRGGRR
jgi:ParB-like chromosome segregation protein Spo0J